MEVNEIVVLIVNHSAETLALLRNVVEEAGMAAIIRSRIEFSDDELLDYVAEHRPHVVLYDITYPFAENLADFRRLRGDPRVQGCGWVALSTSQSVVRSLTQSGECVIAGKPFDLDTLTTVVVEQAQATGR